MLRLTTDSFAQISSTNANNDGILNFKYYFSSSADNNKKRNTTLLR